MSPSCEPMQSPSGRMWPTIQMVLASRMASRTRSMIWGWGFNGLDSLFRPGFFRRRILFQLFDDLHDAVAAVYGIINHEPQRGCVFQDNRFGHEALDPRAILHEQFEAALLLVRTAKDADEHRGGL